VNAEHIAISDKGSKAGKALLATASNTNQHS
jgi:hypothetical protein